MNHLMLMLIPEEVKINVIEGEMIDSTIGYIRIKSFMNENTTEILRMKLKILKIKE